MSAVGDGGMGWGEGVVFGFFSLAYHTRIEPNRKISIISSISPVHRNFISTNGNKSTVKKSNITCLHEDKGQL